MNKFDSNNDWDPKEVCRECRHEDIVNEDHDAECDCCCHDKSKIRFLNKSMAAYIALQRELVEALKEAITTATSGYRAGVVSVDRWENLIARAEAML